MLVTDWTNQTTEKLLRLCYNCSDVQRCETEEICLECFHEQAEPDADDADLREAFRMYAY